MIRHLDDFYILEIKYLYLTPASYTLSFSYTNSFKKGKNVCRWTCVRIVAPLVINKNKNKQTYIKYAFHWAQALIILIPKPKIQTSTWEYLKSSWGVELGQHLENHGHLSDNLLKDVATTFQSLETK